MKQILLFILLAPLISIAQKDTAITYSDVVTIDNSTKSELFTRARTWFNNSFKSGKDVIQVQDKETGEISGKGVFQSYTKMYSQKVLSIITFQVNIRVKDGKYKYEITNFYHDFESASLNDYGLLTSSETNPNKPQVVSRKISDIYWNRVKDDANSHVLEIIASLKKSMAAPDADF